MPNETIPRTTVLCLGVALLISWGVSYYSIGVFGQHIAQEMGWSLAFVSSGFTVSLLTMAAISGYSGQCIDRFGGRRVMTIGALLTATGCFSLASAAGPASYLCSWVVLGIAMRLTLYDAAFASLVRIAGTSAQGPMATVTLFGGFASTLFWPLGDFLASDYGWRYALRIYGLLALLCILLYRGIPALTKPNVTRPGASKEPQVATQTFGLSATLYAISFALGHTISSLMSAHLLGILSAIGLASATAVWISTLRGFGQVCGRIIHILAGGRVNTLTANALAMSVIPVSFAILLFISGGATAAALFVLLYGSAQGVSAITQGAVPLVLYKTQGYGARVGRLLVPSFVVSSVSPIAFGYLLDRVGVWVALTIIMIMGVIAAKCSIVLWYIWRR